MSGNKKTEVVIGIAVVVFLAFCVFVGVLNKKILSDTQSFSQPPPGSVVTDPKTSQPEVLLSADVINTGVPAESLGSAVVNEPPRVAPSPTVVPQAVFEIPPQSDILVQ